ncbi:MAG: acyl-CoA thioesterase [Salinispira sp.]
MAADRIDGYDYALNCEVRDYELDMQGIVNNAVYQNYLEHCRHGYLKAIGFDFAELTRKGIRPVVTRAEIDYVQPLRSGDIFFVGLRLAWEGRLRNVFYQEIVRNEDIVCRAKITTTILDGAVPIPFPEFRRSAERFREQGGLAP